MPINVTSIRENLEICRTVHNTLYNSLMQNLKSNNLTIEEFIREVKNLNDVKPRTPYYIKQFYEGNSVILRGDAFETLKKMLGIELEPVDKEITIGQFSKYLHLSFVDLNAEEVFFTVLELYESYKETIDRHHFVQAFKTTSCIKLARVIVDYNRKGVGARAYVDAVQADNRVVSDLYDMLTDSSADLTDLIDKQVAIYEKWVLEVKGEIREKHQALCEKYSVNDNRVIEALGVQGRRYREFLSLSDRIKPRYHRFSEAQLILEQLNNLDESQFGQDTTITVSQDDVNPLGQELTAYVRKLRSSFNALDESNRKCASFLGKRPEALKYYMNGLNSLGNKARNAPYYEMFLPIKAFLELPLEIQKEIVDEFDKLYTEHIENGKSRYYLTFDLKYKVDKKLSESSIDQNDDMTVTQKVSLFDLIRFSNQELDSGVPCEVTAESLELFEVMYVDEFLRTPLLNVLELTRRLMQTHMSSRGKVDQVLKRSLLSTRTLLEQMLAENSQTVKKLHETEADVILKTDQSKAQQ